MPPYRPLLHGTGLHARKGQVVMSQQNIGYIIAGVGGLVALLAFFFMPFLTVGPFSFTGQQLASAGNQISNSAFGGGQLNQLQTLWLAPVVAGIATLIAAVQLFRSQSANGSSRWAAFSLI